MHNKAFTYQLAKNSEQNFDCNHGGWIEIHTGSEEKLNRKLDNHQQVAPNSTQITNLHGRNLVGDGGDMSPSLFYPRGTNYVLSPPLFDPDFDFFRAQFTVGATIIRTARVFPCKQVMQD